MRYHSRRPLKPTFKNLVYGLVAFMPLSARGKLSTKRGVDFSLFIDKGDVVVFCGIWRSETVETLLGANGGAPVYLFEADPSNYEILQIEKARRSWNNVHIHNVGISGAPGTQTLQVSKISMRNKLKIENVSSDVTPESNYDREVEIKVDSLDNLIKNLGIEPDIIVMTVSGAEYIALKSASNILKRGIKIWLRGVMIDENEQLSTQELSGKLLEEAGYNVYYSPKESRGPGGNLFAYPNKLADKKKLAA